MIFCRKCCVSAHFYVHRPVCFYYRAFRLTLNKSYSNHNISFKPSNSFPTDRFKTFFIVLGFNDTLALVGHLLSTPREREKRDRRDSRGDEREGHGREENE